MSEADNEEAERDEGEQCIGTGGEKDTNVVKWREFRERMWEGGRREGR